MSSSEEETSLIKSPQPPKAAAAADRLSSEKAKAERLRRQKELQARLLQRTSREHCLHSCILPIAGGIQGEDEGEGDAEEAGRRVAEHPHCLARRAGTNHKIIEFEGILRFVICTIHC